MQSFVEVKLANLDFPLQLILQDLIVRNKIFGPSHVIFLSLLIITDSQKKNHLMKNKPHHFFQL